MDIGPSKDYILSVARQRLARNQTIRQVNKFGTEIETLGAAGELAALRFLGLDERLHTGFDDGVDLHFRGFPIDVKATKADNLPGRHLQWPVHKPIKALIILMTAVNLSNWTAEMIGFAFREEIQSAHINYARYTPCYELPIVSLHNPWSLFNFEELRKRYRAIPKEEKNRGPKGNPLGAQQAGW